MPSPSTQETMAHKAASAAIDRLLVNIRTLAEEAREGRALDRLDDIAATSDRIREHLTALSDSKGDENERG